MAKAHRQGELKIEINLTNQDTNIAFPDVAETYLNMASKACVT
jgi:hypothetical protein